MLGGIWTTVYWWLRPILKWILRRTTKLCELQRVCYGESKGAQRTKGVEFSLDSSKTLEIHKLTQYMDGKCRDSALKTEFIHYAVFTIIRVKQINVKLHKRFTNLLTDCMSQIWGYRQLFAIVESRRRIAYDSNNVEHEAMLLKLWELLMPGTDLVCRVTKQWQHIGFQGDDPRTDFRGMGILGLENLLFFAENYTSAARHVLARSHHPQYGYSFAIVGINMTSLAYDLMHSGVAKPHFYNSTRGFVELRVFHQLYTYLFYEFDVLWRQERPRDIMQFNRVREKFELKIRKKLEDPTTLFKCRFVLENV